MTKNIWSNPNTLRRAVFSYVITAGQYRLESTPGGVYPSPQLGQYCPVPAPRRHWRPLAVLFLTSAGL